MSGSNIKSLEQGRAKFAYERAKAAAERKAIAKEYKSYAKKLPMMIKNNGLGAALAFAFSKSKADDHSSWGTLYKDIKDWLFKNKPFLFGGSPGTDLAEAVVVLDSTSYRAVTIEVLALLNWLRRFTEGLIEGEAEN
jgi:CRISPR-associated protein Cmr5